MAKVDIILTGSVSGLGAESDQIKVAAGYARNYLFPKKLAIPLTEANERRLNALKERRRKREEQELKNVKDLRKALDKLVLIITVKTGEGGRMFGSVNAATISDELKSQFDISLDRRKIDLDKPIRSLGDHEVQLKLHHNIESALKLRIVSSTPLPEDTAVGAEESVDAKTQAAETAGEAKKRKTAGRKKTKTE
ncbi:MAG: 50S ribosomal protein L9 [Verrucomicrobia bacterium]|nr:50S ribosomal protein L9 [Verrucomicrobiota bacterium]MCF7708395.1 50S ribosomal protein L9 [Verrucomicrobiota bacterium]